MTTDHIRREFMVGGIHEFLQPQVSREIWITIVVSFANQNEIRFSQGID